MGGTGDGNVKGKMKGPFEQKAAALRCVIFLNPVGVFTQAEVAVMILYALRFASLCGGGTGTERCTGGNCQPARREARLSLP